MFGLSFGAKKTNTNQTTDVNKVETAVGDESKATTSSTFGQTNTSTSGQTNSQGQQTTSQTGTQSQTGTESGSTKGTVTSLGADVQAGLSDTVKKILAGGVTDANIAAISNAIGGATNFNADEYVRNSVLGARTRGEETLQETNSARNSQIGGTAATNSMAALLASRGRNDLEANLAGIEANATATAADIKNKGLATAVGAQGGLVEQASGAAGTLKGATTTTDMTTLSQQLNELLTGSKGETNTAEQQATQQQQSSQTLSIIDELVKALSNQTTSTVGTEAMKGNEVKFGGGFSFGL